jgi:hypothetical protein
VEGLVAHLVAPEDLLADGRRWSIPGDRADGPGPEG